MAGAESTVGTFVGRAARRLTVRAALEGSISGVAAATVLALVGWPARDAIFTPLAAGIAALVLGAATRLVLARPTRAAAARAIERAAPASRNVVLTAFELDAGAAGAGGAAGAAGIFGISGVRAADGRGAVASYVRQAVRARAADVLAGLDPARLFPARGRAVLALAAIAAWLLAVSRATGGDVTGRTTAAAPMIDRVDVTVTPPSYTGRAASRVRNPDRVEVLAGSDVVLRLATNADSIAVTQADTAAAAVVTSDGRGAFSVRLRPRASGFVVLEPLRRAAAGDSARAGPADVAGDRRLVVLTVVPDAPPVPRIVVPGRDEVLPDGHRALEVAIEATDDIGLESLALRYTKASGTGERFTFVEGEVPLTVRRASATAWTARVHWPLDSLALQPGDIVVYRAVATDRRPGGAPVESDAFVAEIAAPGSVAAGGFSLDPDDDRSALSQQMIVLKAERLLAAQARLGAAALADSAAALSAEQRRVRAEFVFMMGGEVADASADTSMTDLNEEAEAAGESDLLAGREMNAGRVALRRATRAMSLAARDLDRVELATALDHAREAVKRLEEAFARNRILLRALAEREALDPARRLSGALTELARAPRAVADAVAPAGVVALRDVLAEAAAVARTAGTARTAGAARTAGTAGSAGTGGTLRPRELSLLAERTLRADPASRPLQDAAAAFTRAAAFAARGDAAGARRVLDDATIALAAALRAPLVRAGAADASPVLAGVRGRLVDALRGRRGNP